MCTDNLSVVSAIPPRPEGRGISRNISVELHYELIDDDGEPVSEGVCAELEDAVDDFLNNNGGDKDALLLLYEELARLSNKARDKVLSEF